MKAPGVWFGSGSRRDRGILRWMDEGGPTVCNSNDGKRSEWVNFLRKGDTVQLVPDDGQEALLQFKKRFGNNCDPNVLENNGYDNGLCSEGSCLDEGAPFSSVRVFGISLEGRPMGSEPKVICEWRCG